MFLECLAVNPKPKQTKVKLDSENENKKTVEREEGKKNRCEQGSCKRRGFSREGHSKVAENRDWMWVWRRKKVMEKKTVAVAVVRR